MLMRTDPFRDLDRLTEAMLGTRTRPAVMPMDAYREDNTFVIHLDLPGVATESIDLTVERNVLTVHAERRPPRSDSAERVVAERSHGVFSRQVFLGDTLDAEHLTADYDAGVLTITHPHRGEGQAPQGRSDRRIRTQGDQQLTLFLGRRQHRPARSEPGRRPDVGGQAPTLPTVRSRHVPGHQALASYPSWRASDQILVRRTGAWTGRARARQNDAP